MVEPLRIAMTSFYLPSESKIGAGYMAHRLANTMTMRGHKVTMFSPCRRPEDAAYHHTFVAMSGSLRTFRWALRVRQLDLDGFDIVHMHGDNHLRVGKPTPRLVRTLHGSCFSEAIHIRGAKGRIRMLGLGLTELAGSLSADETVAVSRNSCRFYPWVHHVIPNGVDLACFHPGDKSADPTILFVGTYAQRKRGRLLMDVFANEVLPSIPSARLWMVCNDAPPAPNVDLLGRINDDELARRYRQAWAFCLPSSYEGFGVPYIEALASGTAVIATRNPGACEVLDDGRFGEVVDKAALGKSLVSILRDPVRRARMADAGLARASTYDWDIVAAAYERIYQ